MRHLSNSGAAGPILGHQDKNTNSTLKIEDFFSACFIDFVQLKDGFVHEFRIILQIPYSIVLSIQICQARWREVYNISDKYRYSHIATLYSTAWNSNAFNDSDI